MNYKPTPIASWINVLAGIWLILAPFILVYNSGTPQANDIILGLAIGIIALIRIYSKGQTAWLSWINFILGIWLIIAPYALGYTVSAAKTNDIIVGIIVAVISVWAALSEGR